MTWTNNPLHNSFSELSLDHVESGENASNSVLYLAQKGIQDVCFVCSHEMENGIQSFKHPLKVWGLALGQG